MKTPIDKGRFAIRHLFRLSTRMSIGLLAMFVFVIAGASAIYALVITNQSNTNLVLFYGVWDYATIDVTADLQTATGPISWSTTGVPANVTASFTNASNTGATLNLTQQNNGPNAGTYQLYIVATASSGETTNTLVTITVQPRAFNVTGTISASNKTYDGTSTATITSYSLSPGPIDILAGDDVSIVPAATFANANVGTGKTVSLSSSTTFTGAQGMNYYAVLTNAPTTTASITQRALTITPPTFWKVYDRSNTATAAGSPTLNNAVAGDVVAISGSPSFTYAQTAVGTGIAITPSVPYGLSGGAASNYSLTQPTMTGDITKRTLSIAFTGNNKIYDGTDTATVTASSDDRISGDVLGTISTSTAQFTQSGIGSAITINISGISANGADAGNYTFPSTATASADITVRTLTIGGAFQVTSTRVYDSTTSTSITNSSSLSITNAVSADLPNLSISGFAAQFATKNAGTSKTVSLTSATLGGTARFNYTLSLSGAPTTTATITAKPLAVTITASNKAYDGNTTAAVTYLDNRISGDVFTVSGTANFDTKDIGAGKTVTATAITLSGTDAANYSPNSSATAIANITGKSLTIGITGGGKTYDGTTAATVTFTDNRTVGDNITISGTATYATKTAGAGKTITATGITVSGPDAGNYSYNTTATVTATIATRALTVGISSAGKTYDRTTAATVTFSDNRISGDVLTVSGTATYADKTAAASKTITATGISISGTDAANYSVNTTATTTATISKKALAVTITSGGKVYDASTTATVTYLDDRIASDVFTVSGTATYSSKTIGTGKTITASSIALTGTDSGNYTPNTTATTTANITARALTITGTYTPSNKVYDATNAVTVTPPASPTLATIQGTDNVTLSGTPTFTFAQATIGTAISITTSNYSLAGTDAGNYTLTLPTLSANITARALTIGGTLSINATKVYDAALTATFIDSSLLTLSNVPAGDAGNATKLALASPDAQYATKTVGTGKTVSVTSASLSGTAAGNYTLSVSGAPTATASITARTLTVSATGINRAYNGTTTATVTLASDKIAADTVTLAYTSASFATKIAENAKTVSVSGISISGADSGNYSANTTTTATANITARALTVTITATSKTYDATNTASVTYASDKVAGDVVNISGTATFANKSVGTSKTVTASSISITGADAANYSANTSATTTANITAKPLAVTITASNKVYDGTATASVTYADDRIAGDVLTVSGTPTFSSSAVGNAKTVTAVSISLSGTDSANYSPNTSASTTANITVRTLTVTISGGSKTYDASTAASVTYASDKVAADTVTITGSATFADKTIGAGKTVTAINISISGVSASNYVLGNTTATTTATISKQTLTITGIFTASNRAYDGTTDATGNVSLPASPGLTAIQGADNVSLTGTPVFTFAQSNVGTAISITSSGYSLAGTDAGNYTLTQLTLSANITSRVVTIGGSLVVPSSKVFDSTTSTSITNTAALTLVNVASADAGNAAKLALSGLVAQYDSKNIGTGKTVSLTSSAITGISSANYTLSTTGAPTTTASITVRSLAVTITATNRVYNATTAASVTYADNRVSGDVLTVSGSATFSDKNIGTAKTVTAINITLSGTDAANYSPNTTATTTANITARPLTVTGTFTVANRQYDATTNATSQITLPSVAGLSDVQAGDDATLTGTPTFTFTQATVGTSIAISTSGYSVTGVDAGNYALTQPSFTANITQRPLTIGGTLGVTSTKVYTRTTAATITDPSLLTLVNVPAGDANNAAKVALTGLTATYSDKNVGVGKLVSVATASLTGTTSTNYTITTAGAPTTTADITQKPITLGFTMSNKTYDATVNASVTFTDTRISGDVLTVTGTPTFPDKNVGANKTVTATNMSISGADAANYSFNTTATTTASIVARSLAVTITASNKTYDGTATASVVYADSRITGDVFTVSGAATFSSKTYGLSKVVTASAITLTGTDATNYTQNTSTTTTASITKRTLTVTITAANKTYDQTATASVTYFDDRVSGDVITISGTPTFSDKNVGTAKTVTASGISVSNTDAGNYTQNTSATTTADITKRSLTIGITPSNKVYNANTTASVTYTDNRISGDLLTFTATTTFSDKNVGTAKTVTASGISVSNTDAGNYSYNTTATATANITARPLTVTGTFTVANRQYDATTNATSQITLPSVAGLSDVQAGDDATLSGTPTFTFAQATVGTSIAISTSGYSVAGVDATNYALTQPSFTANITQRPLTIGGALVVASSKVYDKGVTATITDSTQLLLQNVPSGDANNAAKVGLTSLAAAYADKNVAVGKPVTLTAASLTGTTSTNYTLSIVGAPTTTADITRKSVTITITPSGKTYDGTDAASVTYQDTRISGDVFTVSGTATFSDKNVAVGKIVTASGISLSGADSGNYTPNSTATSTATISRRALAVTTTGVNKVYDRTTTATVTFNDNRVSGDVFTYSATSTYATKTIGTAKTVSTSAITLSGTDSGNYTPNTTASTTANITVRTLNVTVTANNKTYDGNTVASVTYLDDRVSGDVFTVTGTATFDTKNVGTSKTVSVSSIAISGADSSNYTQNTTTSATANITVRTLNVTAVADAKMYDANTNATATYSDDRVSGDVFTVTGTATFATKTAATGKTVSITNIAISGTDAANYSQNTTTTATADITQRPLEVTGTLQALDKVYDGTRTATYSISDLTLVGVQANDSVGVSNPRGRFRTDANVGTGKLVELTSFQFTGTDLGNYAVSVNNSPITYAAITVRTLNVTISASNKTYDGTNSASVTYLDDRVAGDVMTVTGTSSFSDKNVGTGKTVTATNIAISGMASANYTQNTTTTTTANITAKALAVTITASNKTYDGNATASVVYSDNRVTGDVLTVTGTPTFSSKTVGTAKVVTANSISISGTDSGNYTQNTSTTTTANITSRSLSVTITASNKVYDRTTTASVVYSDNRVTGDVLTVTGTPTFSDKNVANGKTVTAVSIAISGTDAANYTQNTSATTTADITAKPLNVTISASNKVYNALTAASVTYLDNRITSDVFTVSGTATFDDKTAANGKTVTATGITLTGTDASNYSQNTTATTTANVTKRPLTVTGTFTVANRAYDATTDATSQVTLPPVAGLSDVQAGDDTSLVGTPTFTFAQATIGNAIGITTSGYSLSGVDANNYALTSPTFTANITARPLTIGGSLITASTKTYDRTTAISITDTTALTLVNVPAGDANTPSKVALSGLTAQYSDKTVAAGKTVSLTAATLSGTTASNYTLSLAGSPTTTADITLRTLAVTITATNKTYDGTTTASVTYADNRASGDIFTVSGTPTFNNKNVGTTKTVTASGITITGTDAANYAQNTTATNTANITTRTLAVTITATNKTYDGNTVASVTYLDNRVSGDDVTVSGTPTFANKNIGTAKVVTANSITLSGVDAGNYTQNTSTTTTANITARTLTVTITATNKTYDGNTVASVTYLDDRVSGDVFTVSGTPTFSSKTVGTAKTVTASGIAITGTDAANYTRNTTATTTADITLRTLTITITASNKVYDGTDTASVTYSDNRVSGDVFTVSGTPTFNNKNVGTTKTVTVAGLAITGTDAANYTQNATATATANVTAKSLAVTITASNKVYDGNTTANVTYFDNRVSGDVFTISGTSTFATKTVGTAKTVTATGIALSGTDAANYTQNTSTTATANITARTLALTATASDKTYDRTTAASVSISDDRVSGNVLTISYSTSTFASKTAAANKTVTVSGISVTGTDAANYTYPSSITTTATINPRTLNVTATPTNKVYDGTDAATVSYTDDRVAGDLLTVTGDSTFSSKTTANGKTVTSSNLVISGADAGNYALPSMSINAISTANITPRIITITGVFTVNNHVYDATTDATPDIAPPATPGLSDIQLTDNVSLSGTPTFTLAQANVGTSIAITTSGYSLAGADAANYSLTLPTFSANITQRPLTIGGSLVTPSSREYNRTTSATISTPASLTLINVPAGDDSDAAKISLTSLVAAFADKNVANGKTVALTSAALTGTKSANYTLTISGSPTATADITPKSLTVTITATNRTYDATDTASVTYADNRISGDQFTVSGTATFADKNVGTGKTVTATSITLTGTDANNYTPSSTATTTATITTKSLTVTISALNKTYNGTTSASVTYLDNRVSGDVFTVSGTATFADKNIGTGKTVTASGITLAGTDANNYTQNTTATTTADITTRTLTVTITASNKTYDSTNTASVTYADNRVSGDVFTVSGSPSFADKNVGTGKTVTATGISISGADSANYTNNSTASNTADITQRQLVVTLSASHKVYDGNTEASTTISDNRVSGDIFTISYTPATFTDKHVGIAKTVTATNLAISGFDAANYSLDPTTTTTANISRRPLVIVPVANNKTYDTTNIATVTYTDNRLSGDSFAISSTALFDDGELGRNKPVAITNITLTGADAGNYVQNTTASSSGNITVRAITASIPMVAANTPTSVSTPAVVIGELVPYVDTTVTFSKPGSPDVTCSFVPQSATDTCPSPALSDGTWTYRARQLIAGLMVAASDPLTITIDTTAPTVTKGPSLAEGSDTGLSTADGITNDSTPTIVIPESDANQRAVVKATRNGVAIQCAFTFSSSIRSCTLPVLTDGTWTVTFTLTDAANNTSVPSPALAITVDTEAPLASAPPTSATTTGSTTTTATPVISAAGIIEGDIVTINGTSARNTKSSCSFTASSTVNSCKMATMESGPWTLTAIVSDVAGNVSPESAALQMTVSAGRFPSPVTNSPVIPIPSFNKFENTVTANIGTTALRAGVQSITFIVQDANGKVVRRTSLTVNPDATTASIVLPRTLKGAKVTVVTTNQCGVSTGAPRSFNVRIGKTYVNINKANGEPSLLGEQLLPDTFFGPSDLILSSGDKAKLDKLANTMANKCGTLLVSGFSRHNTTNTPKYLSNLALFRAQAVADYLSRKGLNMWIKYQGFVVKSNEPSGRLIRRVELRWVAS